MCLIYIRGMLALNKNNVESYANWFISLSRFKLSQKFKPAPWLTQTAVSKPDRVRSLHGRQPLESTCQVAGATGAFKEEEQLGCHTLLAPMRKTRHWVRRRRRCCRWQ